MHGRKGMHDEDVPQLPACMDAQEVRRWGDNKPTEALREEGGK